jgi:FtsH-binding integral membrane protein
MIVTSLPIWIIDMVASVLMIVFSFLCLSLVGTLRNRDNSNVIWTYLFWVCLGLAGFAVSRSAGHIVNRSWSYPEMKACGPPFVLTAGRSTR